MVNLEEYRTLFFVATLGLALVAAYPALSMITYFSNGSEEFTEFWLLGPMHTAEDYPFNVSAGEVYNIFVCLSNHMGSFEYYRVSVRFGNTTQLYFNRSNPSPLIPLNEFRVFSSNNNSWESPVTFEFQNVNIKDTIQTVDNTTISLPIEEATVTVDNIIINGLAFPVNASTSWDSDKTGFYFRLAFELWRYDNALKTFTFHDRVVGLRLNMSTY